MKSKILSACIGIIIFFTLGVYSIQAVIEDSANSKEFTSKVKMKQKECDTLKAKSSGLMEELTASGKVALLNNIAVAENFAAIEGGNIESITAMKFTEGKYVEIVSTTSIEDVEFFTETIDAVKYNFVISDVDTFLEGLKSTMFLAESMDISLSGKTATILVTASSNLYYSEKDVKNDSKTVGEKENSMDGELNDSDIINGEGVYEEEEE